MATGTVYLDVDDEITSAAARIRGSEATKLALVVPYGSRIATSRMNFRLLSREAVVNNRRLSIIASDPATRALAASAGLPVFASVSEWDASAGTPGDTSGETSDDTPAASEPTTKGSRSRKKAAGPPPVEAPTLGLPAAAGAGAGAAAAGGAIPASAGGALPAPTVAPYSAAPTANLPPAPTSPATRIPVVKSRSRPRVRGPVAVIVAALVLGLVVAGVGAYVFLPSADIVITPRQEAIGPIDLVVRADPDVASPDATLGVVPAEELAVPVSATGTFPATDKRVVEKAATGQVVFQSLNTSSANTVAKGSIVSTEGGIRFQTAAAVTLPRAQILPGDPPTIQPSSRTVGVVAATAGTAGNVPANAIVVIPRGEDPTLTKVRNPDATGGGTHEEFPRIAQKDVDAAVASLESQLLEAFNVAIADGAGAAANATVFDQTAVLGEATPTVDPATLVGKEQATFELGLTATGNVIAVDSSPVVKIAETRLLANVGPDYRLVEGSIQIVPGDPTVSGGVVTFPVTAKAARVRILDPAEIRALVTGRSIVDARSLLAEFGDAVVTPWPDWVSSIPGIDSRVTIEIVGQSGPDGATASPGPSGGASPSVSAPP